MTDERDVDGKLALQAGKAMLKGAAAQAKADVERAGTSTKLKIIGAVVGLGVLAVVGMTLIAKLWLYAVGALVVGGAGLAGYLVVKPKIATLKQKTEAKLLAGRREREAEEARRAAAEAEAARKQKLEDELAALKAKR